MKILIQLLVCFSIAIYSQEALANRQYWNFYLLRNNNLRTVLAISMDDCISKCSQTSGCGAASYHHSNQLCLLSTCNQLDMIANNGWNTVILSKFRQNFGSVQTHYKYKTKNNLITRNFALKKILYEINHLIR